MTKSWHQNFTKAPAEERTRDGMVFDSKAEMLRYIDLQNLERGKAISGLQCQREYQLVLPNGRPVMVGKRIAKYTADFVYWENGQLIHEDYKGFMSRDAKLRIAIFEAIHGVKVRITGQKPKAPKPRKKRMTQATIRQGGKTR